LAELGAELAGTLQRAHHAKHPNSGAPLDVIHRDVKPANVMITKQGGVRLLDFGVARAAFSSRESQTHGLVLGTLNYFPPEVLIGGEPSPAVDIYGLGLALWESATARPWGSPQMHRDRFERRVETRVGELSDEYKPLAGVISEMMCWDPADRISGGAAERALLRCADELTGEGIRTWARRVVPPLLERRTNTKKRDDYVGKTFPIEGGTGEFTVDLAPKDLDLAAPKKRAKPSKSKKGSNTMIRLFAVVIAVAALVVVFSGFALVFLLLGLVFGGVL
jgi:serine/threonine-protein kinase